MSPVLLGYLIGVVAISVASMIGFEVRRQIRTEKGENDFDDPCASMVGGLITGATWPVTVVVVGGIGLGFLIIGGVAYMLRGTVSLGLRKARVEVPDEVVVRKSMYY